MLSRLGRGIYRVRWLVLALTLVIVATAGYFGIGALDKLQGISNITDPTSESTRAQDLLFQKLGNNNSTDVLLVLSSSNLRASDPAFQTAANQLYNTLKARPEIAKIESYYTNKNPLLLSRDQHEILITITFNTNSDPKFSYNSVAPLFTSSTLHVDVGGWIASDSEFNQQVNDDLIHALVISLPLLALFLFLIFGGLIAGLLPLLIGIIAIIGSFAVLRAMVSFIDVSDIAVHVIAFVSLGLAIDYSLFIVTRFREELERSQNNVPVALGHTMRTAGRTVLFSGLTVGTSLLCLLIFPEEILRSVGLAAIASALVAVLASLTILPALLALLGTKINAISLRFLFQRKKRSGQQGQGAWYRMAQFAMRWCVPVIVVIVALDLLLGSPFLHAQFSTPDERSLPANSSARVVVEHLRQDFVNVADSSIEIAVTTPGNALSADNLALLHTYIQRLEGVQKVRVITSLVTLDPSLTLADYQRLYANVNATPELASAAKQLASGNVTEIILTTTIPDHDPSAMNVVRAVRAVAVPAGLSTLVGGDAAADVDLLANLQLVIPQALVVMFVAIFVLLFLLTGSLLMPLKAIVLNVFSLSATFGALVWIFQDGHLQNLLGFQSVGSLDSSQTVLIFAIAFGLSMDYEVFLLSRIKEQFDQTGDNKLSVALGLQSTGWLITCAALLLAIVAGAFATSKIIFLKELGLGVALAVLMDAVLIRCLLVPAMMRLLGAANWWAPAPLKAAWSFIGLREAVEPVSTTSTEQQPGSQALQDELPADSVPR